MTDREKLVELLVDYKYCPNCSECLSEIPDCWRCHWKLLADYLMANGVTVQKWIPVSERLPKRELPPRDVLVLHDLGCGKFIDRAWYSYDANKWRSHVGMRLKVTHWMPLPQPPKECE